MKKLLFLLVVIGLLSYYGLITINGDKLKSVARTGVNTTVSLAKKVNTPENRAKVKNGLDKMTATAQAGQQ